MKLNVEIESGSLEKFISDGIKSLTQDELKDIIKQAILEAFTKCEDFKNLLIKRNNYSNDLSLGPIAELAVKNIDLEKELAPVKDKMVKALMENHSRIVENMFLNTFIDRIAYDSELQNAIKNTVYQILSESHNR